MICTPIQEGGEPQHSDLTRFNVAIDRNFLNYMVVFIGQLCQPTQNCVETKLSKLSLLSQLKPLLKLFSSASKASYKSF